MFVLQRHTNDTRRMNKHCILWIVGFLSLFSAQAVAARANVLANDKIRVTISDDGKLESVENLLASETYAFESDLFALDTDLGLLSNKVVKPARARKETGRVVYEFDFGQPAKGKVSVDLAYTLGASNGFFRRSLKIANSTPLRLKNLLFGKTTFTTPSWETLHYVTFIAAPTVEFIRYDKGGLFTGVENPYFQADLSARSVALSFEPALILKPGEGYSSEPQFMGVYKKSGVMIEDSGREFRYNANGSGYKPLDRNENRAMRAFALDYLRRPKSTF